MKRILVTGINGFAGRHLAPALHAAGYTVAGIDIHQECCIESCSEYMPCDMLDSAAVKRACERLLPDAVFHLAGISVVSSSYKHAAQTFRVNIGTTVNLLDCLTEMRTKVRLMVISSGTVYRPAPVVSEESLAEPSNPYSSSKYCAEIIARDYARRCKDLEIVILRPMNHFGPWQRKGFLVPDLCSQIAAAERKKTRQVITVGDLSAVRDYTPVKDVIAAYIKAMESGSPGEIYNIASGVHMSVKEIMETLMGFSSARLSYKVSPDKVRKEQGIVSIYDTAKLRKHTGWQPACDIKDSLKECLVWWRTDPPE